MRPCVGAGYCVDRVLLAIVLLAVLGAVTDAVVGLVERVLVRRWG